MSPVRWMKSRTLTSSRMCRENPGFCLPWQAEALFVPLDASLPHLKRTQVHVPGPDSAYSALLSAVSGTILVCRTVEVVTWWLTLVSVPPSVTYSVSSEP